MEKILKADKIEEFTPGKGVRVEGIDKLEGINFDPTKEIDLRRILGAWYNAYTQTGTLSLKVGSNVLIGSAAVLPIKINGNTITVTGAIKDPKSHDASTTSGDTDRYVFWKDSVGIYYSITNLGQ